MKKQMIPDKRNKLIRETVLVILAVIYLFPIFIAVLNSFKTKGEILASALSLPAAPTLENYRTVFRAADYSVRFRFF